MVCDGTTKIRGLLKAFEQAQDIILGRFMNKLLFFLFSLFFFFFLNGITTSKGSGTFS